MLPIQTRRRFLTTLSLTGAAGLFRVPRALAAEPPPETTTVRLPKVPIICFAPQYVCEELLRVEGFTDVRYLDISIKELQDDSALGRGRVDFASNSTLNHIADIDAGAPITI
jgi:NitT/TauT family transport system substrate-binding protein